MGVKTAEIRHATADEIPAIVSFTRMARTDIFPMIDESSHERTAAKELSTFSQTYLDSPDGAFFVAQVDGVFVGSIAYAFYDYRFPYLHLGPERTVEVVRLYVTPAWRRTGLASKLFGALKQHACRAGVQRFYLHTHPFLPGATDFWERQGFSVMHVDDDPVWRTIHMELHCRRDRPDVAPIIMNGGRAVNRTGKRCVHEEIINGTTSRRHLK